MRFLSFTCVSIFSSNNFFFCSYSYCSHNNIRTQFHIHFISIPNARRRWRNFPGKFTWAQVILSGKNLKISCGLCGRHTIYFVAHVVTTNCHSVQAWEISGLIFSHSIFHSIKSHSSCENLIDTKRENVKAWKSDENLLWSPRIMDHMDRNYALTDISSWYHNFKTFNNFFFQLGRSKQQKRDDRKIIYEFAKKHKQEVADCRLVHIRDCVWL